MTPAKAAADLDARMAKYQLRKRRECGFAIAIAGLPEAERDFVLAVLESDKYGDADVERVLLGEYKIQLSWQSVRTHRLGKCGCGG